MINDSGVLKGLQTRKKDLNTKEGYLRAEIKELNDELSNLCRKVKSIDVEIESLTAKEPVITEHAILKYIERVMGFDLENVKSEILNDKTLPMVKGMKSGKFPLHDGHKIVVKDMTIVTII